MARVPNVRLLQIENFFRHDKRLTIDFLAGKFEVSRKTIKRDLDALRDQVGLEIEYDRKRNEYVLVGEATPPTLSPEEFIALSLSAQLLTRVAGTRFEEPLRQALDKVRTALPESLSLGLEEELQSVSFGLDLLRGEQDVVGAHLALLNEAISSHHTVSMKYFAAYTGEEKERRVDPYYFHTGSWYCIGYCHLRKSTRTFAVQRMTGLTTTRQRYEMPADFDLKSYLRNAWYLEAGTPEQLVVRFGPRTAVYIRERRWHPTQELEELPDGGLILRANVFCGGEVLRWVLQHGSEAEVLEPAHLREKVADEVAKMVRGYGEEAADEKPAHFT